MIAIAIICLAVIASTSSQASRYNGPAASLLNSPEFKRYLTMNGFKPLDNFNPAESSNQERPNPAQVLESLQKRINATRDEMYQSVDNYLMKIIIKFKNYIIDFLENASSFVEHNQYEIGNATIQIVDHTLQKKYNSFVSNLMIATDNAVEDYNIKAATITQKLELKLAELNRRTEAALGREINSALIQKPTNNGPGTNKPTGIIDINDDKMNFQDEDKSKNKLRLPEI